MISGLVLKLEIPSIRVKRSGICELTGKVEKILKINILGNPGGFAMLPKVHFVQFPSLSQVGGVRNFFDQIWGGAKYFS